MSAHGTPDITVDATGLHVAVVASQWHAPVMDGLLDGALRAIAETGARDPLVVRVPGSWEVPVACARLVRQGGYDAVIALGVIIRGGTPHFEYVCQGVTSGLMSLAVETAVPIGFGVLTCDNEIQARDRSGIGGHEDKGYDTTVAALATACALRDVAGGAARVQAAAVRGGAAGVTGGAAGPIGAR